MARASEREGHPSGMSDRLGVGVSATCAVHCAAMGSLSFAPSLTSSFGSSFAFLESIEIPLLVGAFLIGLWSLVPSYRHHERWQPLALFCAGLSSLVVSRFLEGAPEVGVTVAGVVAIALAHIVNLRACASVEHRDHAHS